MGTMMRNIPLSQELKHGRPVSCEARHEGDEWACACGVRWSVEDQDPPDCRRKRHVVPATPATVAARKEFVAPDEPIKRRKIPAPEELTNVQLAAMVRAYIKLSFEPRCTSHDGMRAAYRALLDSLYP